MWGLVKRAATSKHAIGSRLLRVLALACVSFKAGLGRTSFQVKACVDLMNTPTRN